jgi:diguanylate cyclase (GGDEF)-like protein
MGHDAGDKLLVSIARRLTHCIRKTDRASAAAKDQTNCLIARLGGDEFTVILSNITRVEDAGKVATRIIDGMARPFDLDGRKVKVAVSIGISVYPDDGSDILTLLKHADIAMYQAKGQGGNKFNFYTQVSHVGSVRYAGIGDSQSSHNSYEIIPHKSQMESEPFCCTSGVE